MPSELAFWDVVDGILDTDGRYRREAYGFLMTALGRTVQELPEERLDDPARRHLSGGELLAGLAKFARAEFGALAPMVFHEWGVRTSSDIGVMVFQLVASGQLSARPEDTLEDFRGFDLTAALESESGVPPPA